MASILNPMRGIKAKKKTQALAMTDKEYDYYLAEVTALSKKDQNKWKRRNELTDGSIVTIRFAHGQFYANWLNQRVILYSLSEIRKVQEEIRRGESEHDGFGLISGVSNDVLEYHSLMDRVQAESSTGNHGPRNHPVRIPTQAGEPVRG